MILEPVELFHRMDHAFAPREKRQGVDRKTKRLRWIQPPGCARCGGAKTLLTHHGTPPSFNVFGSGANRFTYQGYKQAWQARFLELLDESGLPRELDYVLVEGELCFPQKAGGKGRDQGNFKVVLEKAMGDALEQGGYVGFRKPDGLFVPNDNWEHYEFGSLAYRIVPGECWTRLLVMPRAAPDPDAEQLLLG